MMRAFGVDIIDKLLVVLSSLYQHLNSLHCRRSQHDLSSSCSRDFEIAKYPFIAAEILSEFSGPHVGYCLHGMVIVYNLVAVRLVWSFGQGRLYMLCN